ncbi:MAG: arylesterase, partial [Motiliproteus sp.]|nr:arylesterase [Motiliproteus sp.]
YYPFFLQGVGGHPELMQLDGLHPNSKAQPLLLDNVWPLFESLLTRQGR